MSIVEQVVEFNSKILCIGQREIGHVPDNEYMLGVKCLFEEISEFEGARSNDDLVGCIDALADLLYFGIGLMYKHGLSAEKINRVLSAVHEANMTKQRGIRAKRATGAADAIKPDNWVPPEARIAQIIGEK